MKISHLLLLLILLVALAAGLFFKTQKTTKVETRDLFIPLTLSIKADEVFEIEIQKAGDKLTLKKITDKGWFLETLWNAPVQEDKVTALLKLLAYVQGELRTTDENLWDDFGLSDSEAYSMKLKTVTGQTLMHLLIGTHQPDELSVFFRKAGDAKVYLSDMPLLRALNIYHGQATKNLDQEFWLDLNLTHRDFKEAKKLTIKEQDKFDAEINFEKTKEGAWEIRDPLFAFETDSQKVESLLSAMSSWVGLQVADPKKEYGFRDRGSDVKVIFEGQDRERFFIVPQGEGENKKYYAKKEGDFRVMEIAEAHVKRLETDKLFFIKNNPFAVQPKKIKEILLRHKTSEMFLGATAEQMDTIKKIADVFEGFEFKVMRLDSGEDVTAFKENVPYELVLRESAQGPAWNFGFGEKNVATNRYPMNVKGDERLFTISEDTFQNLFFPFLNEPTPPVIETPQPALVSEIIHETIS